jgi:hypothetical protein
VTMTLPPVDFPLYGIPADQELSRRLDHVEAEVGSRPFGVWLWHGDARGPAVGVPWLRVGSLPRERHARLMTSRGGDPVREVAFAAMFALINATMPRESEQPDGYGVKAVDFASRQSDTYAQWSDVTWRVDGHEVPARLFGWAGAWTGFTTAAADVDLVAVGHGLNGRGLSLVELSDTSAYHFDYRSPIVLPDDAKRGEETTCIGESGDTTDHGWPLHPDHDAVTREF